MQITFPATSPDDIRLENKNGAGETRRQEFRNKFLLKSGRAVLNAEVWSYPDN
jgi:hypothetical protein